MNKLVPAYYNANMKIAIYPENNKITGLNTIAD